MQLVMVPLVTPMVRVPVLRVLQVMAQLAVQMVGVLQAMSLFLGAAIGEDSGNRNCI